MWMNEWSSWFYELKLHLFWQISRICCPVPLYHCIGMVLACLQIPCHGSTVVFPSKVYDAGITLKAMQDERLVLCRINTCICVYMDKHNTNFWIIEKSIAFYPISRELSSYFILFDMPLTGAHLCMEFPPCLLTCWTIRIWRSST